MEHAQFSVSEGMFGSILKKSSSRRKTDATIAATTLCDLCQTSRAAKWSWCNKRVFNYPKEIYALKFSKLQPRPKILARTWFMEIDLVDEVCTRVRGGVSNPEVSII